jgi:hypothetical protein
MAEEGGENEVAQPVNPAANVAANIAANSAANTASNALEMHKTMPPMLEVPNSRMLPPTQERTRELNLHKCKPTALRAVNVNAYETKWR